MGDVLRLFITGGFKKTTLLRFLVRLVGKTHVPGALSCHFGLLTTTDCVEATGGNSGNFRGVQVHSSNRPPRVAQDAFSDG